MTHRTYTGVNLLGMFLCYTSEVRDRLLFFNQRQLLRQQQRTQALAERLHRLSREDSLTGLANRRSFDEALDREWRRCQRDKQPLTLMLVDVDCFKAYNDHYGHLQGDRCLQQLSNELRRHGRRGGDVVARFGGEEFVMLYPGIGDTEAQQLAARVCRSVRALALPHSQNPGTDEVTVSIGVAVLVPTPNQTPGRCWMRRTGLFIKPNKVAAIPGDCMSRRPKCGWSRMTKGCKTRKQGAFSVYRTGSRHRL